LWVWEPYIPARGLTVLAGPPGVGKTWLALAMAARVSMEKNVLLLTDKADWGCIVRPRLDAMAANVNNVYGIDTSPDAMRPGEWLSGKLGALIREKQAGIVIVDTVELFANTLATRAALDRAAGMKEEELRAALERAIRADDELTAQAIAHIAWEKGESRILEAYMEHDKNGDLRRLYQFEGAYGDRRTAQKKFEQKIAFSRPEWPTF
jgi:hypothetical protein